MLNQFPLIFPFYSFNTVCLGLKALHAQEERDRLRLDFNELEERVNLNFIFFVSFLCSWCVIFFSLLATGSPFPNSVCMYVYTFVHKHLCNCTHCPVGAHQAQLQFGLAVSDVAFFYLGVSHAFPQQ